MQQRTWTPNAGILFKSQEHSSPRSASTVVSAEYEQGIRLHSNVGDKYVLAVADDTVPGTAQAAQSRPAQANNVDPTGDTTASVDEVETVDSSQDDLPCSEASFKMTEELFRAARNAEPGSTESFWSHILYRGQAVDGKETKVKVHYCRTKQTTERTLQYFLDKKIIGFDIEWKAEANKYQGAKKNVSLIQLACEERIALFHIALYPKDETADLVAPSLKKIMEDPGITKVGVAIKADCTRLRKYLDIHAQGTFELSHLYKLVRYSKSKDYKQINKLLVSLATQVQEHLHLPMFKGDVRSSDWSQPLNMEQIIYAASDSYAGIHLYDTLEMKRKALDPTPPRPFHAEENKPIRLAEGIEIPTDEAAEELEPEDPEPPAPSHQTRHCHSRIPSTEELELVLDSDFTVTYSKLDSSPPVTRSKSTSASKAPSAPSSTKPVNGILTAAECACSSYRLAHPDNRTTTSCLRAYFIWHEHPELSLSEIAAMLREVPLQISTVVNYILEAIRVEKLPYRRERLREVLACLPEGVVKGRYRGLGKAVEPVSVSKVEKVTREA